MFENSFLFDKNFFHHANVSRSWKYDNLAVTRMFFIKFYEAEGQGHRSRGILENNKIVQF